MNKDFGEMLEYITETPAILKNILELYNNDHPEFENVITAISEGEINKIILTGSGTSLHAGLSVVAFMEEILLIDVEVEYPMLFIDRKTTINKNTLVIGSSQGGESKSTIKALEYAKSKGCLTIAISSNSDGTQVYDAADLKVLLACGEEKAGPKTKGYQANMLTLVMLALRLALKQDKITKSKYDVYIKRLNKVLDNLSPLVTRSLKWYEDIKPHLVGCNRIVIVGYTDNYGNILEGRLKVQEAVRFGIEAYELEEFMHGIYHSIDESVHLVYLASGDSITYKQRITKLSEFLKGYTDKNYVIGKDVCENDKNLNFEFIDDDDFSFFEYIIPLQILASEFAKELGINPNIPKIINFHYLMESK